MAQLSKYFEVENYMFISIHTLYMLVFKQPFNYLPEKVRQEIPVRQLFLIAFKFWSIAGVNPIEDYKIRYSTSTETLW